MEIIRHKQLSRHDFHEEIIKHIPELTDYQKETIGDYHNGLYDKVSFDIVQFVPKYSENIFYRFSSPFYYLIYLLAILLMPLKYVITGEPMYGRKTHMFFEKWYSKL